MKSIKELKWKQKLKRLAWKMKHVYKQLYKIMTKDSQSSYLQLLMSRSITSKLKLLISFTKLLQVHEHSKYHILSNQYLTRPINF